MHFLVLRFALLNFKSQEKQKVLNLKNLWMRKKTNYYVIWQECSAVHTVVRKIQKHWFFKSIYLK